MEKVVPGSRERLVTHKDSQIKQIKPLSPLENPDTPAVRFRIVQKDMDVLLARVIRRVINAMGRQTAKHQGICLRGSIRNRRHGGSLISETLL